MIKLLAIVEVDKNARVLCQSEGCGKSVYKRIHVVNENNKIIVLGQTCYSHIYGGNASIFTDDVGAYYTSDKARKLTAEERNLLLKNTEKLIEQFENEKRNLPEEKIEHSAPEAIPDKILEGTHMLRNVNCHYCQQPMKTRAKSAPVVGYKCEACTKDNRGMPSGRSRSPPKILTNAYKIPEGKSTGSNTPSNTINSEQAEAYKNIRG